MVYCQKAKQHGGEAGAVDFERDYIMRMIQMMGDFFRRIADMVDDRERALLIDAQARQHCGMPLATAEALEPDMLAELLPPAQRFVMSELLHTKGRACASLPAAHREALLLQSLRLLSTLNGDQFAQRAAQLQTLKRELYVRLTAPDLMRCARFFAQAEAFDAMEDALFQALAFLAGEDWLTAADEGMLLLRRAAKTDEFTLALCNMTRQELWESAHELSVEYRKRTGGSA